MLQISSHDMRDRCARFVASLQPYLHGDEGVWPDIIAHVIQQLPCEWMQPDQEAAEFRRLREKVAGMDYRDLPEKVTPNGVD